jgi:hypothetical protein
MWVLNFVNLSSGASMLLYDGSPFYPRPTVLLELAAELGYDFCFLKKLNVTDFLYVVLACSGHHQDIWQTSGAATSVPVSVLCKVPQATY